MNNGLVDAIGYGQKFDVVVINFLNKSNAADQRVYQLLDQKFQLFNGVFGASDEVLGSIESGVDFEKRIAKIYQTCRRTEDIQEAFDQLQKELEPDIEDKMDATKKQLLENFDEEVHQKLKFNMEKGKEYLNQYEQWLWNITRFYLQDYAEFDQSEESFRLKKNPFPGETIHPGPYLILRTKDDKRKTEIDVADDTNVYRIGHPLAQRIIGACKSEKLPSFEMVFDYTNTPKKITLLEELSEKSGWLQVSLFSITSFETEEHLLLSGITDNGNELDSEICRKFFSIQAKEKNEVAPNEEVVSALTKLDDRQISQHLEIASKRNAKFFTEELDKLDKWAEDKRNSLKTTLKELDEQIKEIKKQSRFAQNLPEKLKLEKDRRKLEQQRDDAWKRYDDAAKDIDKNKDLLIDEIEKSLRQKEENEKLFLIRWKIK